jgi:hypothetical protein
MKKRFCTNSPPAAILASTCFLIFGRENVLGKTFRSPENTLQKHNQKQLRKLQ